MKINEVQIVILPNKMEIDLEYNNLEISNRNVAGFLDDINQAVNQVVNKYIQSSPCGGKERRCF
jgi:hypothetical protein